MAVNPGNGAGSSGGFACALSASGGGAADLFGCPVTVSDGADRARTLSAWSEASHAFLAHAACLPDKLADCFAADPDFVLGHLCKGYFMLLLGRRELVEAAVAARAHVAERRATLNARELAYLEGLDLYLAGRIAAAADRLDAAVVEFPRDAVLIKLVHALRFVIGDGAGMRASLEQVLPAIDYSHPGRAYVLGCYAFALEETGAYLEAERIGRDAVARRGAPACAGLPFGDAWGLHAVAHVFDMTNRATDGVAWIAGQRDAWDHCNNFKYHVWWHLALFHLDRGETAEVLRLYDEEIRVDPTDDYRDHSNAASLLTRLELDGVDVGSRWEELADIAERRVDDGCVVFADLHYMLALGATGRADAQARLVTRLERSSEAQLSAISAGDAPSADMDHVAAEAGAPAAAGLYAFARGDYAQAFAGLAAAEQGMPLVGGSWAQRDVFERVAIDAALRAGLLAQAQERLQRRLRRRGALDSYAEARLSRISELRAAQGRSAIVA